MPDTPTFPLHIRGAVLERSGDPRPYADSAPSTISDLELSAPGSGEVLVRMRAAGICHSDLSVVNNNRPRPLPMLLGHEASGIVEAVGDHVVMTFLPRCGDCAGCATNGTMPCEKGSASNTEGTLITGTRHLTRNGDMVQHHLGVSGFATHAVVSELSVVPIGKDVPADILRLRNSHRRRCHPQRSQARRGRHHRSRWTWRRWNVCHHHSRSPWG